MFTWTIFKYDRNCKYESCCVLRRANKEQLKPEWLGVFCTLHQNKFACTKNEKASTDTYRLFTKEKQRLVNSNHYNLPQ